ncbi:MAG: hypothetical protein RLP44_23245 [Aggregatilineales bacterium]
MTRFTLRIFLIVLIQFGALMVLASLMPSPPKDQLFVHAVHTDPWGSTFIVNEYVIDVYSGLQFEIPPTSYSEASQWLGDQLLIYEFKDFSTSHEEDYEFRYVIYDPLTGARQDAYYLNEIHATQPAFSPDLTQVVFEYDNDLSVLNLNTQEQIQITDSPERGELSPTWSTDNCKISYLQEENMSYTLMFYDICTDESQDLLSGINYPEYELLLFHIPLSWSASGHYIMCAYCPLNTGEETQIIDTRTSNPIDLDLSDFSPDDFSWSPTSDQILFKGRENSYSANIFIADLETGDIVRVTDFDNYTYFPTWSPDGRQILFGANTAIDSWDDQIFLVNADGSDLRRMHKYERAFVNETGDIVWLP